MKVAGPFDFAQGKLSARLSLSTEKIMATIAMSSDQDAVLAEIHIAAPPERVFQAISRPESAQKLVGPKGRLSPYRRTIRPPPGR